MSPSSTNIQAVKNLGKIVWETRMRVSQVRAVLQPEAGRAPRPVHLWPTSPRERWRGRYTVCLFCLIHLQNNPGGTYFIIPILQMRKL